MSNNLWWVVFLIVIVLIFLYPVETKDKISEIVGGAEGNENIVDISTNPEEYVNRTVTVRGALFQATFEGAFNLGIDLQLDQLPIKNCLGTTPLAYNSGESYKATGIIKSIEICTCEIERSGLQPIVDTETIEECWGTCREDSIRHFYYLECTEPFYPKN